ncbi:hypothetical protein [Adhaeribacter radiodurans]|uniref:Uncharacterized protein n=1 Tax=Adhaeribacter radiodurans TaxID=2745197 RepID=A0A7L7LC73_9BACT|nr:hypothetical protein [Adhaeribacter radiodurans]QMU30135.1 hypothetical protein HUW48_19815 [Adhaeribacter radiodurans]
MKIVTNNPKENTLDTISLISEKCCPTLNGKDLNLTLTPLETDILVDALFFYQSAMHIELTGEQITRLESIYKKIGIETEYKIC